MIYEQEQVFCVLINNVDLNFFNLLFIGMLVVVLFLWVVFVFVIVYCGWEVGNVLEKIVLLFVICVVVLLVVSLFLFVS